ncbi:MAG: hypothetical protein ABWY34_08730 [Pseudoxanthomonas sp.]
MKPQRLFLALLAALLLFAQQAAYAHAVSHIGGEPPAKDQLGHAQLCGKCVSFEKLSSAAPVGVAALVSITLHFAQPVEVERAFLPLTVAAFQSRAPPVLH